MSAIVRSAVMARSCTGCDVAIICFPFPISRGGYNTDRRPAAFDKLAEERAGNLSLPLNVRVIVFPLRVFPLTAGSSSCYGAADIPSASGRPLWYRKSVSWQRIERIETIGPAG